MTDIEHSSDDSGILKAKGPGADQITVGSAVVSIEGKDIGRVKEVDGEAFLIDRPRARDLWAPFSAVVRAGPHAGAFRRGPTMDTRIVLFVRADEIDDQGWRKS